MLVSIRTISGKRGKKVAKAGKTGQIWESGYQRRCMFGLY
jgi:hypothetical protein